jgi:hypothetical protein
LTPKSHLERAVLERFRELCPDFPPGKILKSEAPDFIIKNGRKLAIGIELTSLPEKTYELSPLSRNPFLSDLNETVSKKIGKLRSYQKNGCNEYWLVIHVDSLVLKLANFENLLKKASPGKGFDRVFLIALFEGKIWEINDLG